MISMVCLLNENKMLRYTGAALSGLGGLYTGGGAVGAYQANQKTQYGKQQARLNNNSKEEYEHQNAFPGRVVKNSILGSVPIVGSAFNLANQMDLEKQKEKLKQTIDSKNKK